MQMIPAQREACSLHTKNPYFAGGEKKCAGQSTGNRGSSREKFPACPFPRKGLENGFFVPIPGWGFCVWQEGWQAAGTHPVQLLHAGDRGAGDRALGAARLQSIPSMCPQPSVPHPCVPVPWRISCLCTALCSHTTAVTGDGTKVCLALGSSPGCHSSTKQVAPWCPPRAPKWHSQTPPGMEQKLGIPGEGQDQHFLINNQRLWLCFHSYRGSALP